MEQNSKNWRENYQLEIALVILFVLLAICAFGAETTASIFGSVQSKQELDNTVSFPKDSMGMDFLQEFSNGTGTAQIEKVYYSRKTLSSAASETVNLSGGISDVFGNVLNFSKMKGFYLKNLGSTTIKIGNGFDTPFLSTGSLSICASGGLLINLPAGLTISSSTEKLNFTNSSGGTGTFDLWFVGN